MLGASGLLLFRVLPRLQFVRSLSPPAAAPGACPAAFLIFRLFFRLKKMLPVWMQFVTVSQLCAVAWSCRMGGRGSVSGNGPDKDFSSSVRKLGDPDSDGGSKRQAKKLLDDFASKKQQLRKQDAMQDAEKMTFLDINGVRLWFSSNDDAARKSARTLAKFLAKMPAPLRPFTKSVTLTKQHVPGDPDAMASSGDGDGNITVYGGRSLDAATLIHEAAHNYVNDHFKGYDELDASPYYDAYNSDEPGTYPQQPDSIEEDFAEAVALYVLAPKAFAKEFPQRAAVIQKFMTGVW